MTRRAWSLRWVIGGTFFFIMVLLLGALALYVSHWATDSHMASVRDTRRGQALLGASLISSKLQSPPKDVATALGWIRVRSDARYVTLLTPDGQRIAESPAEASSSYSTDALPQEVQLAIARNWGQSVRVNPKTDEETLYTAVAVTRRDPGDTEPQTKAILVLAAELSNMHAAINDMLLRIGLAFGAIVLVLFFVVVGISNSISAPLATLSGAAERFASGKLNERVSPEGAAEVASLGESFNRMAEHLRATITRLAQERAQAEAVLTSMVDGLIVTDMGRRILLMNHSAEQICGIQADAAIGKTLPEALLHFELGELLEKTLATGLSMKHEVVLKHPLDRVVEVHMAPVEAEGHLLGVVVVLYDITQHRHMEQVHRDFVANVSHELRTPVASVRAMAETIAQAGQEDPEMAQEFLATIISESERLSVLLDDLLQISRLEAGHRLITPESVDLCEVIRHVAQRVIAPIADKNQHLVLDVPASLIATVDRAALLQVLVNLLDNARKYSPEGAVITVWLERRQGAVAICVQDTGMGIAEHELARIFERFYRVDKARSRAQGGTGLGLAIVKQLVELHGGWTQVESELDRGSTFTVVLPQPDEAVSDTVGEAGELPTESTTPTSPMAHSA